MRDRFCFAGWAHMTEKNVAFTFFSENVRVFLVSIRNNMFINNRFEKFKDKLTCCFMSLAFVASYL